MKMTAARLNNIVRDITFPNTVIYTGVMGDGFYIQVAQDLPDNVDFVVGATSEQRGRKFYISSHAVESEVVQTALKAILTFLEHEAREQFRYKGVALLGPHLDVNVLLEIADRVEVRV